MQERTRMKMIEIWINCPNQEIAKRISDALIASRRVACANIFPAIESSYHWKGRIESDTEVPLVVKTRKEYFAQVAEEVRKLHPYETPSIIGMTVKKVNDEYLEWVYSETERSSS